MFIVQAFMHDFFSLYLLLILKSQDNPESRWTNLTTGHLAALTLTTFWNPAAKRLRILTMSSCACSVKSEEHDELPSWSRALFNDSCSARRHRSMSARLSPRPVDVEPNDVTTHPGNISTKISCKYWTMRLLNFISLSVRQVDETTASTCSSSYNRLNVQDFFACTNNYQKIYEIYVRNLPSSYFNKIVEGIRKKWKPSSKIKIITPYLLLFRGRHSKHDTWICLCHSEAKNTVQLNDSGHSSIWNSNHQCNYSET